LAHTCTESYLVNSARYSIDNNPLWRVYFCRYRVQGLHCLQPFISFSDSEGMETKVEIMAQCDVIASKGSRTQQARVKKSFPFIPHGYCTLADGDKRVGLRRVGQRDHRAKDALSTSYTRSDGYIYTVINSPDVFIKNPWDSRASTYVSPRVYIYIYIYIRVCNPPQARGLLVPVPVPSRSRPSVQRDMASKNYAIRALIHAQSTY